MMKSGQAREIERTRWSPVRPGEEVEVLRIADVARRVLGRQERLDFHLLALYRSGTTHQEIDFARHACRPGTLVHVAPGQANHFALRGAVDGWLLLFLPTMLPAGRGRGTDPWHARFFEEVGWPTSLRLRQAESGAASRAIERLRATLASTAIGPLRAPLVQHALGAALLELAAHAGLPVAVTARDEGRRRRARRFEEAVERSFRVTRSTLEYARALGCTPKMLDRVAREAYGTSAKRTIDARVLLEARRLLAHGDAAIADIAEELGFEPTNFVKFMKARTGQTPGAFRAARRALDVAAPTKPRALRSV